MKFKSIAISIILGCLNTCVFAVSNDCSNADDCYQKAVLLAPENELTSDSDEIFDIDYFSKAEKYLIKTCQMSHAESCLLLGLHYGEQPGNGGMVLNFAKSAMYLRKSCELKNDNGCASAINLFKYQGMCCEPDLTRGNGVHLCPEKCSTDAVNFLDNLCDRNNKNACATAGYFIRNQYKGINEQQKTEKARQYYQKGCDLNSGESCNDLAELYDEEHLAESIDSLNLYLKACELKNQFSCTHIGEVYLKGEKVKKELKKAVFLPESRMRSGLFLSL